MLSRLGWVMVTTTMAMLPFYLDAVWLQIGLFLMAAVVGALGLDLLTGVTGQLSLAHPFFIALGGYTFAVLAGPTDESLTGFGLPPALAAGGAILVAGLAGGIFSPVSARVRGLYLGVASLSLIFLGQHLLQNSISLTGGGTGRSVVPFSVGGFSFTDSDPDLFVLGVQFGREERLWYLFLGAALLSVWLAHNILRSRSGRAMAGVRDSEVAARVMGVNVGATKAAAFVVSSMFAGAAGVMLALVYGTLVPASFGLHLAVAYVAMVVIGGLGTVYGAVVGATFVTLAPELVSRIAGQSGLVDTTGLGNGVSPLYISNVLYGIALIVVMILLPRGIIRSVPAAGRRRGRRVERHDADDVSRGSTPL